VLSTRLRWREIDTAFESRILTDTVINSKHIEHRQFFENASEIVLNRVLQKHANIKINTAFNDEFVANDKLANKSVSTRNYELFRTSDLREWYELRDVEPTLTSLGEFQESSTRDSGWTLSHVLNLAINVNKYNPLHAGCYIELPREIMMER